MPRCWTHCLPLPVTLLLFALAYFVWGSAAKVAMVDTELIDAFDMDAGSTGPKGKLVFAHVIFRHGDRTPIEPYPTDPWGKLEYWPTGWGQLTNTGKQQHYRLGQWLRKRYDSLLNRTYSKDEIYVYSTDVDRTLMSAQSNLAGLYPPAGDDVWNNRIDWQPIPVHTVPERLDRIMSGKLPCAAYDYAFSALMNSPEFQTLNDRYAYLFRYLTQHTGREVSSFEAIQRINNTLYIEQLYNKTLPEWTKKVYPTDDMSYLAGFMFSVHTYTRYMARLKAGPLIKEILERFQTKAKGKLDPDRNVWIYSGHDLNIAVILNALKLFEVHSPPYTACILMELRIDEQQNPFVSIYYKNTSADPLPMDIPGCGTQCPLSKLFSLYQDILPDDWEAECKLSTMMMKYEDANLGLAAVILLIIISLLLILSYVIIIYYRRRSYRSYYS